jgi:pSer/pThr/pTyr-binding forkhead associated (FHA) protein
MGKTYKIDPGRSAIIGRDPQVEVSVPSDRVSRRHCQLSPKPDGSYVVSDLGSSNGTLINQIRLSGSQVLQGGEYIQTGDCLFRFVVG